MSHYGYYNLSETLAPDQFSVKQQTGEIYVKKTGVLGGLNFETVSHYIFGIRALDGGFPPLECEGTVQVEVLDVNEPVKLIDQTFQLSEIMQPDKSYEAMALGQMRFGIQRNEIPMTMIVWDEDALSSRTYSVQGGPLEYQLVKPVKTGNSFW